MLYSSKEFEQIDNEIYDTINKYDIDLAMKTTIYYPCVEFVIISEKLYGSISISLYYINFTIYLGIDVLSPSRPLYLFRWYNSIDNFNNLSNDIGTYPCNNKVLEAIELFLINSLEPKKQSYVKYNLR
jgi:hypothetical protein